MLNVDRILFQASFSQELASKPVEQFEVGENGKYVNPAENTT